MDSRIPVPAEVWTIGHSTLSAEEFIGQLAAERIQVIADVRRFPGSRRNPQFGRDNLKAALQQHGIQYQDFADLGGRRDPNPDSANTAWRNAAFRGYADFMETIGFEESVGRLRLVASTLRAAIMCAELLWWRCHRSLLADYFKARGTRVWHIMNGKAAEHTYTAAARIVEGRVSYRGPEQPEMPGG